MTENSMEFLITTNDNPYDPITQFDDWNRFDCDEGYNTWQRIDKLMPSNYLTLSLGERNSLVNKAMERMIELFPFTYYKVFYSQNEESLNVDENSFKRKKRIKSFSEIFKKNLE